jgi:hypothetical protein
VLWIDLGIILVAGLALYVLARRADTSFAWTIKAPITAAFLGAGYWGAGVGLAFAAVTREWQRIRVAFVIGFTLTGFILVPTFIYLDQFHLDEGSTTQKAFAWVWLILYILQTGVALALFAFQERLGGRYEYAVSQPLLPWFRLVLLVHVLALTAFAIAIWPVRADGFWPWPLPDLGAAAVAVWLATFAAGAAWCLRERDWRRARIIFPAYFTFLVLLLLAALRFRDSLDGDAWQTWTYIGAIVVSLLMFGVGTVQPERAERRLR